MQQFIKICSEINKYLSCVLLLVMVAFVAGNTFLRYFFSSGIIMTEELVRYLFMWGVYLGVVSVWYSRSHIRVTTVLDRVGPRGRVIGDLLIEAFSAVILAVLCYGSVQYYFDTTTVGQVTGIPYSVMILAVLVGTFCCIIISIGHIKEDFDLLKLSNDELLRREQEAQAKLEQGGN